MKSRKEKQMLRESIRNVRTWLTIDGLSRADVNHINRLIVSMQNKLKKRNEAKNKGRKRNNGAE